MTEKVLSIFIDESGDFGPYDFHAPFYLVAMVLHNQDVDISKNIDDLESHLTNIGYKQHAIHTGPLIRRESVYANDLMEERKRLFNALFNFARKLDFHYVCAKIRKDEGPDVRQIELTKILTSVFNTLYAHVEFRKVKPVDYKLFQAADLFCTMELLAEKADSNSFSKSEQEFFCSVRDFKKNYLKPLLKKHL